MMRMQKQECACGSCLLSAGLLDTCARQRFHPSAMWLRAHPSALHVHHAARRSLALALVALERAMKGEGAHNCFLSPAAACWQHATRVQPGW